SSANTIRTPISLAWDGTNLYATDPFDRRVMVFTPATPLVSATGIVNFASRNVNAVGRVDITGTITAGDVLTISIGAPGVSACASGTTATASAPCATDYKYTVVKDDTIATIINALVKLINAGPDPNVLAIGNTAINQIVLSSRLIGGAG